MGVVGMALEFIKVYERRHYRNYNLYRCGCGLLCVVRGDSVSRGATTSCGCVRANRMKNLQKRVEHG
jgi:hypothetical protein